MATIFGPNIYTRPFSKHQPGQVRKSKNRNVQNSAFIWHMFTMFTSVHMFVIIINLNELVTDSLFFNIYLNAQDGCRSRPIIATTTVLKIDCSSANPLNARRSIVTNHVLMIAYQTICSKYCFPIHVFMHIQNNKNKNLIRVQHLPRLIFKMTTKICPRLENLGYVPAYLEQRP